MGIVPHDGIIWKIATKIREHSIKEKDIYFTPITHTDELNIIGKRTALKLQKQEEENQQLNTELQDLKENATEQFNKFIRAQEIQEAKQDIENHFRRTLNLWDNINKFTEYKEGDTFKLHAFKKQAIAAVVNLHSTTRKEILKFTETHNLTAF